MAQSVGSGLGFRLNQWQGHSENASCECLFNTMNNYTFRRVRASCGRAGVVSRGAVLASVNEYSYNGMSSLARDHSIMNDPVSTLPLRCKLEIDPDVQAVLEFMQNSMAADKLVGVAESLPAIARLIWGHYTQRPIRAIDLIHLKPRPSRSAARESDPLLGRAHGDSAGATD
jgi:hypothetical protein